MRDVIRLFEKFLETRSLRLTRQRGEILRAMYATHKHISADDLYDLLRKHDQQGKLKISRATVYRTLSLLSEGGFIQALDLGTEQGTLYEHVLGHDHHDHLICLSCGRIIEFMDGDLERIQDEAVARLGFKPSWHRLNVYGTCKACQAKGLEAGSDVGFADGEVNGADEVVGTVLPDEADDDGLPDGAFPEGALPDGGTDVVGALGA